MKGVIDSPSVAEILKRENINGVAQPNSDCHHELEECHSPSPPLARSQLRGVDRDDGAFEAISKTSDDSPDEHHGIGGAGSASEACAHLWLEY